MIFRDLINHLKLTDFHENPRFLRPHLLQSGNLKIVNSRFSRKNGIDVCITIQTIHLAERKWSESRQPYFRGGELFKNVQKKWVFWDPKFRPGCLWNHRKSSKMMVSETKIPSQIGENELDKWVRPQIFKPYPRASTKTIFTKNWTPPHPWVRNLP